MPKILVIEDEVKMRRNLLTILQMENFEAIGAENGHEGVEAARRELPDLILCDVMMPGCDGYNVLERIRSDHATADIPLIFLTACGEKQDFRHGMNLGADDYLTKPCPTEDLLAAIRARLRRAQLDGARSGSTGSARPDFSSAKPLESLSLTPREAEVLLWMCQGKANGDIATILGMSEKTVKIHVGHILEKLHVENRTAAALRGLEALPRIGV
ncbi:MAG TPA: response regulator transcription factor [Methylomirabilota bacterium]|nr:response regulator transcription factor [Methylomirabilota bacterium]